MFRLARRLALGASASFATSAAVLYLYDDEVFDAAVRVGRCGVTVVKMTSSYTYHRWGIDGEAKREATNKAHKINAERLREMLFQNKGIYIKVGQYLGTLDYMIPTTYVETMRGCFDDAPSSSWEEVEETIKNEMKRPISGIFKYIDKKPIASASLAQVHRGVTHDGVEVAIKVQHPHLKRMARTEVFIVEKLLAAIRIFQPDFGFQWLVEEMKLNIPKELNFKEEARNANRCRTLLQGFGDTVVVPEILHELSTEKVLTMSFEHGCKISDKSAIEAQGILARDVARSLSTVFAELIFKHGFVHCDPHPGNVLVRRKSSRNSNDMTSSSDERHGVQLVILDHGLYRELDDKIRLELCEMWKGIVMADADSIKASSKRLGIRSKWMDERFPGMDLSHTLIAAMLSAKEWSVIAMQGNALDRFDSRGSQEEQRKALSANVSEYLNGIVDVLESCPRDMLLILKANDALRSVSSQLGGLSSDTFLITALASCKALLVDPKTTSRLSAAKQHSFCSSSLSTLSRRIELLLAYARVKIFIFLADVQSYGMWKAMSDTFPIWPSSIL